MRQYTKQLYISSKDRTSGTPDNFTYTLERSIDHVHRVIIEKIVIPFSYYVFNSTNNVITFDEGGGLLGATITPGNYTAVELETEIKARMDAAGADTYTVSINTNNYLLTISSTGTFTLDFTIATNAASAFEYLGFDAVLLSPAAASWTSPNAVNLNGPLMLFLKSNELSRGTSGRSLFNKRISNVIYGIEVCVEPNEIICVSPNDIFHKISYVGDRSLTDRTIIRSNLSAKVLRNIDISIVDDNDNMVDLNGRNIQIQLNITSYDD